MSTEKKLSPKELASFIDHTILKPEATNAEVENLCREASEYGFASVCVNPSFVSLVKEKLRGTNVKACATIGFPLGATTTAAKVSEAKEAVANGAAEVDMVINVGRLKSGDIDYVGRDIRSVVEVGHAGKAHVKVIIETCLLTDEEKKLACEIAKRSGADFVKTSTGFSKGGATADDVALMRRVVGDSVGVKASGGVRTLADALLMIRSGATRIGTSSGVKIVMECMQNQIR